MIIDKFSKSFVEKYKQYVDISQLDSNELYNKLEMLNRKMFDHHEDGNKLKELHKIKRKSELIGDISKADQTKIPIYFLTDEVVGDVKLFVTQMKITVIQFYLVVVSEQDLSDIEEELYECLTDIILTGNLQKIVFSFFKLESEKRRDRLKDKYNEYLNIQPQFVGVQDIFALNE